MATVLHDRGSRAKPLGPDAFERALGIGAGVLLAALAAAVARGRDGWAEVPGLVWLHLLTIAAALALTPAILLRRRGDRAHRRLGYGWLGAMFATAATSMFINLINPGGFSAIHILSAMTMAGVPWVWWTARTHRVAQHRRAVKMLATGALVVAGAFTFPFDRLLGRWLFG